MSSPSPSPSPSPAKRRSTTKAKQQRTTPKKPVCRTCKMPDHTGQFSLECRYHVSRVDAQHQKYRTLKKKIRPPPTVNACVNTDKPTMSTLQEKFKRRTIKVTCRAIKIKTIVERAIDQIWHAGRMNCVAVHSAAGNVVADDEKKRRRSI